MDATTALETGHIKTPSECSKSASESAGSEDIALDAIPFARNSAALSSGDKSKVRKSESSSCESSESSEDEELSDAARSNSEDTVNEDEYISTDDTSESEESWKPSDTTTTEESSSLDEDSEVCNTRHLVYPMTCKSRFTFLSRHMECETKSTAYYLW